ncbi:S-layer homology domain-containing protein [Aliterella atlantica]|uniref:S-layer protein n=1 Tax=Aliterella atlantica CENA595 TaxID=1618023 RepID=A0A0D8ZY88_9CYAN|nr:S-layer homology domain-containing protein [Aliterella atlantica]KJH72171.1 S-layer protein [Aliterella atlantica CENA595]
MTNSPPPDPQSSDNTPLGFDDFIGIFVAFSAIGAIIWWSLARNPDAFNFNRILSGDRATTTVPLLIPSPEATGREEEVPRVVPVPPTDSPEVPTPVQPRTPARGQVPVIVPVPITPASPTVPSTPAASPTPKVGTPINFVDVPQDFWARPYITALSARRVVNGYAGDFFRPNQPITRAEFAALVQAAFDNKPVPGTTEYKDIPTNFWGIPAINSATRSGFMEGYPNNIFRPTQQIPRVQVLVALASGLGLKPPASPEQVLQSYQDAAQIPDYAREKVAAATAAGIVANYPERNLLNPNRNASRAEVTAMLYQALVQAGQAEPIESQYVGNAPQ